LAFRKILGVVSQREQRLRCVNPILLICDSIKPLCVGLDVLDNMRVGKYVFDKAVVVCDLPSRVESSHFLSQRIVEGSRGIKL
jgi:hypothetical protein